jgi:hypothetical protein
MVDTAATLISRAAPEAGSRRIRPEPTENRPLALSRLNEPAADAT